MAKQRRPQLDKSASKLQASTPSEQPGRRPAGQGHGMNLGRRCVRLEHRYQGGDRFRLRTLRQGKRAEEADVVSVIVVGNQ